MSQMADLLERDRLRYGFTAGQAAYRLGLTVAQYRAVLDGRQVIMADTWE